MNKKADTHIPWQLVGLVFLIIGILFLLFLALKTINLGNFLKSLGL